MFSFQRALRLFLPLCATCGLVPSSGHAQATCPAYTLELERIAMLGDVNGPGIIESESATAVRDSRGRYYLTGEYAPSIKVFDPQGKYLTTIGREGQGPGEYKGIAVVVISSGDTIHVFDNPNQTHTVLSPSSYDYVRSTRLEIPIYLNLALLQDGRLVLNSPVHTPDRIGLPLHLMNGIGEVVRSFGSESGIYRPDIPYIDRRELASAGPGLIWSAKKNQYTIELWSIEGRKLKEVTRTADWFPPYLRREPVSSDSPPKPIIVGIREDDRGRLWVLISVADNNWESAIDKGGPHGLVILDQQGYRDTMVEVIDPESRCVLASRRFPQVFLDFADDNLLSAAFLDAASVPFLGVWRAQLDQP